MIKYCADPQQRFKPYIAMASFFWKQFFSKIFGRLIATRTLLLSLLSLIGSTFPSPSHAADIILLPWQLQGWDAEFTLRNRDALRQIHQELERSYLQAPQPFDKWLKDKQRPLSLNQSRRAATLTIGSASEAFANTVYLVPRLCPLGELAVFGLQWVDARTQRLLAATQVFVDAPSWQAKQRSFTNARLLIDSIATRREQLSQGALATQRQKLSHAVKLQLLTEGGRRADEDCLTMLLSHDLLAEQEQIASLGNLEGTFVREQLFADDKPLRATRTLTLDWGYGSMKGPNYAFQGRWAEGVLGGSIDTRLSGLAPLNRKDQRLEAPPTLTAMLKETQTMLRLSDRPEVVRIDRAWAYLDRGRAYGLDMDDRLYFEEGPRVVKAHVVAFFGPSLGIKNAAGQIIQEGAIVYVRKGQRAIRVGDRFDFDPTQFPTPWPPVKQPSLSAKP